MSINVEQTIKERFAAPLADNYLRRIVFWQDPDGEFSDFVDELDIDDVKILKLTGANNFYAKQLLSEIDTESNYLVYNPILYRDIKDNWLPNLSPRARAILQLPPPLPFAQVPADHAGGGRSRGCAGELAN